MSGMKILVTGGNRGIGFEHVRQALAAGDDVIASCRVPSEATALQALAVQYPATLVIEQLDVGDGASIDAFADRLSGSPIDMLINNAGLYGGGWETNRQAQTIDGMDYALWGDIMRVNVIGQFRLTARLLPNLRAGARKLVVMISSDLGSITNNNMGQSHAYRSSKAALNMVTRGLSIDLKDQGISVISMAPGWTKTELGGPSALWEVADSVSAQRQVLANLGPADSGIFIDLTGKIVAW